jgi:hypothetical protein
VRDGENGEETGATGSDQFFWSWMVPNIMSIFHIHGWICSSLVKQTTLRMEQLRS